MTTRIVLSVLMAMVIAPPPAGAQGPSQTPATGRYIDPVNGLSLEDAISRALGQEPSLRSARSQIDVAEGMRHQTRLFLNPTASFERRQEPAGTDTQTTVGVEWPLDLYRGARIAVANRELTAVQSVVADRERLLRSEVRSRYGDVLGAIRELTILDDLVATSRRQHELLRSRVEEGSTPALERNLVDVELRRLQAERLLQDGRADAAMFELKRALGMNAGAALTVRDTLDSLVQREGAPLANDAIAAIDQRPDVREAAALVDVAEAKIQRAQADGRPGVDLFANYMRMDAGFPQQAFGLDGRLERVRGRFNYWSAGAMVTVPLLNRNQGEIAAARAERAGASAAYDAARLTADVELAAARVRDERARQAVSVYTSGARTLARRNLDVVSQSYELGRLTVFDVLTEQRRYLDLERAYTETLKEAYDARTALHLALGGVR